MERDICDQDVVIYSTNYTLALDKDFVESAILLVSEQDVNAGGID